ncbi:MAG: D-alanyl-D-alanine carboxypeptidase [Cyanobacteria bacterium J06600_6]
MFNFIFATVASITAWFNNSIAPQADLIPLESLSWEQAVIFQLPEFDRDRTAQTVIDNHLQNLTQRGFERERQGIWVQSGWDVSASNLGQTPLPAASLTKIATTLAALDKWGAKHQFRLNVYGTGNVDNGILKGDLIIQGSGDPLFVWEEAIALGNALNQLGIREIQGDILINGRFYMNFKADSLEAGKLLQQALDRDRWQSEITQQYLRMTVGTKQPQIKLSGSVKLVKQVASSAQLLVTHRSLPLAEILRQMNIYSNNKMAQMLADLVGDANTVAETSAKIAGFPTTEIKLINGSGLGEANQISPRAVCQMLMAIDRLLQAHGYSASDLFPTAGRDIVGTVQDRGLPRGTTIKTGTLDNVSALAGVIPTGDRQNVYFSIINYGRPVKYLRQQQDSLLNQLAQPWQLKPINSDLARENGWYLGNPDRNQLNLN